MKNLIRITEKEAVKLIERDEPVFLSIAKNLAYYRKAKPVYVLTYWLDDNHDIRHEFNTLKEAKAFAKNEYGDKPYEIAKFDDIKSVAWSKKRWYENGKLIDEAEQ